MLVFGLNISIQVCGVTFECMLGIALGRDFECVLGIAFCGSAIVGSAK